MADLDRSWNDVAAATAAAVESSPRWRRYPSCFAAVFALHQTRCKPLAHRSSPGRPDASPPSRGRCDASPRLAGSQVGPGDDRLRPWLQRRLILREHRPTANGRIPPPPRRRTRPRQRWLPLRHSRIGQISHRLTNSVAGLSNRIAILWHSSCNREPAVIMAFLHIDAAMVDRGLPLVLRR